MKAPPGIKPCSIEPLLRHDDEGSGRGAATVLLEAKLKGRCFHHLRVPGSKKPEGPSMYPIFDVPKDHTLDMFNSLGALQTIATIENGFWNQKPQMLGTWTRHGQAKGPEYESFFAESGLGFKKAIALLKGMQLLHSPSRSKYPTFKDSGPKYH